MENDELKLRTKDFASSRLKLTADAPIKATRLTTTP